MHAATRILVVDDDPSILQAFSSILRAEGYQVAEATSGADALKVVKESHPDLVLLDVMLSPGLDGVEVCRQLKADPALADVFVILISGGVSHPNAKVAGLEAGADEFLAKPLTPAELRAQVGAMVRLQAAAVSLRASELHYRRLIEILPDAVALIDLQGRVRAANPQALAMLGHTQENELLSKTIFDLTAPEDHGRIRTDPNVTLEIRPPRNFECTLIKRNGETLPIELSASVSKGTDGQPDGFVVVARDISERKRAEAALRESEARKAAIMQSALDAIITIDHRGRILEFNSAAEKIFGCNRARVVGNSMATVILPTALRDWFQRGLTHRFAADEGPVCGARMEMSGLRADGTEFPIECAIVRIELEGPPTFTAFVRDITLRQRHQAQLATLAHAVESTGEMISITDLEDRFTFVNHAFQKAYGYTEAEILGQSPAMLFSPNQPASLMEEILEQTRLTGWQGEVLDRRKDGTEFSVFLSTSQIKDQQGRLLGLMGVAQDITERKKAEKQIRLLANSVQSTNEMICITDPENRFVFVNQAFVSAHRYEPAEIMGRSPDFLYASANPPGLCEQVFEQTLGSGWHGEVINRRKDGTVFPIFLSTSQIKDDAGKILGLVGVSRDISEQKRAEKQTAAFSQLGHRLSAATTPERAASIILEIASELLGWDAGFVHLYLPDENKISPVLMVDTVDGHRVATQPVRSARDPTPLMQAIIKNGARLISREPSSTTPMDLEPFGDRRRASASMMYVPIHSAGTVVGFLSIQSYTHQAYAPADLQLLQTLGDDCGDALDRIKVAEALHQAEANYRRIFEDATEGIFQITPDGRYRSANPALAHSLGYATPEELLACVTDIGRQTYVEPARWEEFKRRLETGGPVQEFEAGRYRKDGRKIWTSINGHAVRDAHGAIAYYEGTSQDISRRKQAELRSAAFSKLGKQLSAASTFKAAAQIIVDTADELFGWDSSQVRLIASEPERLVRILAYDVVDGRRVEFPFDEPSAEPTPMTRYVLKHGAQLVNEDSQALPEAPLSLFGNTGRRSESRMFAPMRRGQRQLGILSIQSYRPQAYTPEDLQSFEALAEHCGGALERIQFAESLRESEERFRSLFEFAPIGIALHDANGHYLGTNRAYQEMLGYSDEELKSMGAKRITHADDIPEGQRLFASLCDGTLDFYRREKRYVSKVGRQIWAESSASAVRDAEGQLRYIVSMVDDITGRKQGEEEIRKLNETLEQRVRERTTELEAANAALRESEQQLRLALEASNAGTWTWNLATSVSHWDKRYYLHYGLDARQPASFESWLRRVHPEDRQRLVKRIRKLLRPGTGGLWSEEFRVVRPGGELRWMAGLGRVDRNDTGQAVYFSGINLDITERKQAEEAVRNLNEVLERRVRERTAQLETANQALGESEERFRQVAENINEVFWMTDPTKQKMLYVSPAYAQVWGRSCASLLASPQSWLDAIHPEDRARVLEAALNNQVSGKYNEQYRITRPDGSIRWIRDRAYPVRGADGKAFRVVGVAEDITVRKWAEEELRVLPHRVIEAQETERKRVARELHDGVNQILASAKMRLLKVEDQLGDLHPATREILARCRALLVEALEENRRIAHNLHPSELDELGLTTACRKLCEDFASRTNLTVTCHFSRLAGRLTPAVELNLFRILQESLNNIENHAHARSVRVRITLQQAALVLKIQDDGRGFDPKGGRARKRKWPGIGLSNMRERAASSGGVCEVVSVPNQGTTVTVQVPYKSIE